MKVEVVVLNYNGGDLLLECLPSLVESVRASQHEVQLVLLDNQSTDDSENQALKAFPDIKLVRAPENLVLCSYNDYLAGSDADVVILMNNDIRVETDFIDPLLEHFQNDQDIFMVTSKCMSFDGSYVEGGITQSKIKWGIFWASSRYPGYEKDMQKVHPTMAAGYGAFDRKKFVALGGFDDLYLPGRLEDSDLCFQAWKKGWKLLYDPKSVIYHKGGVAFEKKFGSFNTLRINHRNVLLFMWKNLSDPLYILEHIVLLPLRLLFALIRGNLSFVFGFWDALPLLPKAISKRSSGESAVLSDRTIFNQV